MPGASTAEKIKNIFWPGQGGTGTPVYLQENGELLGHVTQTIESDTGKISGYIIDCDGVELRFPADNIVEAEGGYIYQPIWYTQAEKVIEKLEAQETVHPDLTAMLESKDLSPSKIDERTSDAGAELQDVIEDARDTVQVLLEKQKSFQSQRGSLRRDIGDLTEGRVLGEGNRREFAQQIVNLKRKAKIVESNLDEVNELLMRFRQSPFINVDRWESSSSEEKSSSNSITEKVNPSSSESKNNPEAPPQQRSQEGERIKKIRVLKLEKNLADRQEEVAEHYIKDRIKQINTDLKDLKKIAKENEDNEETLKFVKDKRKDLKKEKEKLQDKLQNVQGSDKKEINSEKEPTPKSTEADLPDTDFSLAESEATGSANVSGTSSGINAGLIARIGSIILIGGLITILVFSLLGIL